MSYATLLLRALRSERERMIEAGVTPAVADWILDRRQRYEVFRAIEDAPAPHCSG